MQKINRYWNSDPNSLVEREPPQTYDLCKCCELVNQLVWKEKRLKRSLWRAIALFCARSCEYFSGIMSHCLMGQDDLYRLCEEKKNKYLNATYKCRAKMEEYK